MLLQQFPQDQLRIACRLTLETLEYWLRRIVESELKSIYGDDYINSNINGDEPVIKPKIKVDIVVRMSKEPNRYPRAIDAMLLSDLIQTICHPALYKYFKNALRNAFPKGNEEARHFFNKLISPRNHLSHANPISVRQAEQVICYSHDIIDSIKEYYKEKNMGNDFNVPRFIKYKDHFGNEIYFDASKQGYQFLQFNTKSEYDLRPDETLSIEVTVDETFSRDSYTINWTSSNAIIPEIGDTNRLVLKIKEEFIGEEFMLQCRVISNKKWHRLSTYACDDMLIIWFRVLNK